MSLFLKNNKTTDESALLLFHRWFHLVYQITWS